MKKLIVLILLIGLSLTLSFTSYALETINYNFIFYEDRVWDINDGSFNNDTNYWATNRVKIFENEITLNNLLFNHILFWDRNGVYLGYYNTTDGGYETTTYLGDTDETVVIPSNALYFALTAYELAPLDTTITELNNHSLREVFEDGNLMISPFSSNGNTGTISTNDGITTHTVTNIQSYAGISKTGLLNSGMNGHSLYIRYEIKPFRNHTTVLYISNNTYSSGVSAISGQYNLIRLKHTINYNNNSFVFYDNGALTTSMSIGSVTSYRNIYVINLTSLGISSLTVSQMDYWYGVYQTILNEDWADGLTNLLFYSMEATYDRDITIAERQNFLDFLDEKLDGLGMGMFPHIAISIGVMIGVGVVLLIFHIPSIVVMIFEILLFILFTLIGWFSIWIVLLLAIGILISLFIKGGSKE